MPRSRQRSSKITPSVLKKPEQPEQPLPTQQPPLPTVSATSNSSRISNSMSKRYPLPEHLVVERSFLNAMKEAGIQIDLDNLRSQVKTLTIVEDE